MTPPLGEHGATDEHRESGADEHESPTELRRARRLVPRRASHSHNHANSGASVMMNSAFSDWNQLLGKLAAEDRVARAAIGEQVQRRAGLLELRPEERGAEEEHADDVELPALRRRPAR